MSQSGTPADRTRVATWSELLDHAACAPVAGVALVMVGWTPALAIAATASAAPTA